MYHKKADTQNEEMKRIRIRFYTVSVWLGAYFPIRLLVQGMMWLYPRTYNSLVLETVIALIYLITTAIITFIIKKRCLPKN